MNIRRLAKIFHTVKYMTPTQWAYRAKYALQPVAKLPEPGKVSPAPVPLGFGPAQPDLAAAEGILRLEFPLVSGYIARFHQEVDWNMAGNDYRLQCFRLNSFDFLHILSDAFFATGDKRYIDFGYRLISHWWENRGELRGDKWNPYPTAQRICSWIGFVSSHPNGELETIAGWVHSQAKALENALEYHLGANHLLTEGKALLYAGFFLRDERLARQGISVLEKEYPTQFLPDGGHYEGSLSYHIESLQQYFESAMLLEHMGIPGWDFWAEEQQVLQRNYQYLSAMLGANGTIPLYNDSAFDYCVEAKDFLATSGLIFEIAAPGAVAGPYTQRWEKVAEPLPVTWQAPATRYYESTGLFADHFDGHSFYLRCGNLGPDCNLGHAHADQLSLLWQTREGEIFADSGVFTYQKGALRDACRATSAHNTVEIDGCNSAEVWAAFRTARRGHGRVTAFAGSAITAEHDGYAKILGDGLTHRRTYLRKGSAIVIADELMARKKSHTAVLRYHLAPGCQAELLDDHRVRLNGKYLLECTEKLTLAPCHIAGNFGIPEDSLCICASWSFSGLSQVKTVITL